MYMKCEYEIERGTMSETYKMIATVGTGKRI